MSENMTYAAMLQKARQTRQTQILGTLPNGVVVLLTPEGQMHNISGQENVDRTIKETSNRD